MDPFSLVLGKTSKISKISKKFRSKLIFEKWPRNFFFEIHFFEISFFEKKIFEMKIFENIFENFEKSLTFMKIEFCKNKFTFLKFKIF
jgi:hypothetical protein